MINRNPMIKSGITINLAGQVKTGPWIYRESLEESVSKAAALGFDGVELFTASAASVNADLLERLLQQHGIRLHAFFILVFKTIKLIKSIS